MRRMINSHVEASKIGRQIADQVMDSQRRSGESSSGSSPDPDPESSAPVSSVEVISVVCILPYLANLVLKRFFFYLTLSNVTQTKLFLVVRKV